MCNFSDISPYSTKPLLYSSSCSLKTWGEETTAKGTYFSYGNEASFQTKSLKTKTIQYGSCLGLHLCRFRVKMDRVSVLVVVYARDAICWKNKSFSTIQKFVSKLHHIVLKHVQPVAPGCMGTPTHPQLPTELSTSRHPRHSGEGHPLCRWRWERRHRPQTTLFRGGRAFAKAALFLPL